jgi:hypothetical protein
LVVLSGFSEGLEFDLHRRHRTFDQIGSEATLDASIIFRRAEPK